jgi:hypothetical protein
MGTSASTRAYCPLGVLLLVMVIAGCGGGGGGGGSSSGGGGGGGGTSSGQYVVLAANDLGMHCMDREFSVFSILPPFNVLHAQVIKQDSSGNPSLMTDAEVSVYYDAVADASGSSNTTSLGKTNFWTYANDLFGTSLLPGEGLLGLYMPDDILPHGRQAMTYEASGGWFSAHGIPITPLDDDLAVNTYPLMRIIAYDKASGSSAASLNAVVPVAMETDCQTCHKTGGIAASGGIIPWAADADLEVRAKKNILLLHDNHQGTDLANSTPVLCAACHYSPALDLSGSGPSGSQAGKPNFSSVMHSYHGGLTISGNPVFPPNGSSDGTCYQCHPGKVTQCLRGAMRTAGLDCRDCHGNMLSVGAASDLQAGGSIDGTNDGNPRRPWKDLPRCQSCHTGDATSYLSGAGTAPDTNWPFRLRQAFLTADASASPLLAVNKRFAENTNTLYRFSRGHGGVTCEGCHGSTHAEWPNASASANDNVAAIKLQGHAGKIMECSACHKAGSLPRTTNGPHGLHNVNDSRWYNGGHENAYEGSPASCKACHGLDLTGTPLAKVPVARTFTTEEGTVSIAKGNLVSCNRCHGLPH